MKNSTNKLSAFHKGQILTEGLILVREDICDWINKLFNAQIITGDTFLTTLHDGVVLCDLVSHIYQQIQTQLPFKWPKQPPTPDRRAKIGSFNAKDNISLFLNWCRGIGLSNTILFETRGLTNSDEEKNIVLTLLHIGEVCADFNMPLPEFAKYYKEMMLAKSKLTHTTSVYTLGDTSDLGSMESDSISARSDSNIFDNFDSECSVSPLDGNIKEKTIVNNQRTVSPTIVISRDSEDRAVQSKLKKKQTTTTTTTDRSSDQLVDETFNILEGRKHQEKSTKEKYSSKNVEIKSKNVQNSHKCISSSSNNRNNNRNIKSIKSTKGDVNNKCDLKQKIIRSKSRDSIIEKFCGKMSPINSQSDRENIDLKIREINKRCQCQTKFCIEKTKLQEGMYKIGSKNIFVRMFRGNVMLRVGGGWETLNEYLNKVDPCCKTDTRPSSMYTRRQSMASLTSSTDLPTDGINTKNLRKLSEFDLITVRKNTEKHS